MEKKREMWGTFIYFYICISGVIEEENEDKRKVIFNEIKLTNFLKFMKKCYIIGC